MRDYDGDEDDGYDETIYPVDHATYGQIVDDVCIPKHDEENNNNLTNAIAIDDE